MKKTEFISVLSAAALIVGTFGACSHNKNKEAGASSPEFSATESQNQDQSQASAGTDATGTVATGTVATDSMPSDQASAQTEQGGQTAQGSQTEQGVQWNWRTMQNEMLNETVVNYLHHINQKEIQMSQWAQDKAQSQQVKNAAQQMMKDHQALESNVQQLATQRNWTLRSFQPATWEQVVNERIQGLSGDQFDQAFIGTVHASHEHTLQELAWTNSRIKDPAVKNLVKQTLQRVRAHRQMTAPMHRSLASGKWQSQNIESIEQTTTQSPSQQGTTTEQGGQEMPELGQPSGAEGSIDQTPSKDKQN